MIANRDADIQEEVHQKMQQKGFEKGKGRGYEPKLQKERHPVLKQNDQKKSCQFKRQNESFYSDSEQKFVGETFIPFV